MNAPQVIPVTEYQALAELHKVYADMRSSMRELEVELRTKAARYPALADYFTDTANGIADFRSDGPGCADVRRILDRFKELGGRV